MFVMNKNLQQYTIFSALAVLTVALARLMPHPFNFTPVGALALYTGAYGKNKGASFLSTLLVMFFSDVWVMSLLYPTRGDGNPFAYFLTLDAMSVYLAFGVTVCIGFLLKKRVSAPTVVLASLGSSFSFYLITNFFSWLSDPLYVKTLTGLMNCYIAGIPFYNNEVTGSFFLNQFVGDLFYSGLFFGAHAWVTRSVRQTARA